MSKLIKTDKAYKNWLSDISKRFRQSQLKAAVKVNDEMLRFYWSVGRDIDEMSKRAEYGSGFYDMVSSDLKDIFPEIKSFSPTNLKYMRYFYEMYPEIENRQQAADESGQQMIFLIPWGHHMFLLGKCKGNQDQVMNCPS